MDSSLTTASRLSGPILPPHIEETVAAIAALHAQHHRRASPFQRLVRRSVIVIGQPRFIALLTAAVAIWTVSNVTLGARAIDRFPFPVLFDIGELLGIYITVLILITQRHEDELTQLREQLTLELAIVADEKTAKIIQLIEELRRDSPNVANRTDAHAAALSVPTDPEAVLSAIMERTGDDAMPQAGEAVAAVSAAAAAGVGGPAH